MMKNIYLLGMASALCLLSTKPALADELASISTNFPTVVCTGEAEQPLTAFNVFKAMIQDFKDLHPNIRFSVNSVQITPSSIVSDTANPKAGIVQRYMVCGVFNNQ